MMICSALYAQIRLLHLILSGYPAILGILQACLLIILLPPRKLWHVALRLLIFLLLIITLLLLLTWMILHLRTDVGILIMHFDSIILKLLVLLPFIVLPVIRAFYRVVVCAVHYVRWIYLWL